MRAARLTAFVLACVVGVAAVGGTAALSATKHAQPATQQAPAKKKKPKKPTFDPRYSCVKAASAALIDSFLGSWQGNVTVTKGYQGVDGQGGSSGCSFVHAGGPFAGQPAGGLLIVYGSRAAGWYNNDEKTAKNVGARNCAAHPNTSGDPRVCGPVAMSGIANQAYEAFFYIAALKGNVFVQLQAGNGVANGQMIPSSTLPPAAALANAMKAILAKLP